MASDIIATVEGILEKAKEQIQANMAAKDINASGRTSKSFRVERYDGGIRLVMGGADTAPLDTLEIGRPGGSVPGGFKRTKAGVIDVSNTFKAILVQWAKDKGIADFGWGAATMLGRRIAEKGTLRHENPTDVYSSVVLDAADQVKGEVTVTITTMIHENLKRS